MLSCKLVPADALITSECVLTSHCIIDTRVVEALVDIYKTRNVSSAFVLKGINYGDFLHS